MDTDKELERFQPLLKQPDYVMEPGCGETIRKYVEIGGLTKVEEVVNMLTSNYIGVAQHVNLMAEWLILSGMTPEEVQELVEDHLQQQLLKHFDISKADEIVSNVSQIPSWLRKMFEYKKWRQLFYKLIEEHPESVFLKFAIKLITDAGYQGEITNLTTAASQLPVFARVIKTSLEMLLSSSDEVIQEKLPKFCEMVNHTEHTYLFTQSLLAEIQEKSTKFYLVRRISQEVELFARTRGHSVDAVWYGSISGATRYKEVLDVMTKVLQDVNPSSVDIIRIFKFYRDTEPPPIDLLRSPALTEIFLKLLFIPSQVNLLCTDGRMKCIWLYGYSSCVHEEYDNFGNRISIDRNSEEIEKAARNIETVSNLLQETEGPLNLISVLSMIFQCIKVPCVAIGVLRWVEATTTPKYLEKQVEGTPVSLALVDEVATSHVALHNDVMRLLCRLLENPFPSMDTLLVLNLKKSVLDRMVHLISRGFVMPVLKYISNIFQNEKIDASLVRHFVGEVLEIAAPPYSDEVFELMRPLAEVLAKHTGLDEGPAHEFLDYAGKRMFGETASDSSDSD